VALTLAVFGVAAVYGASSIWAVQNGEPGSYFAVRQLVGVFAGGVLLLVTARMDYHVWQRMAWPVMGVAFLLLLVIVLPFAHAIAPIKNGARRSILMFGVTFQPSELAKLAVVLWTAMLANKKGDEIREFRRGLLPVGVIIGPLALLIVLEPDLSSAIEICLLSGIILFMAGARIGHFILLGLVAVPLLWREINVAAYRAARLKEFLGGGDDLISGSTQIGQSLIGIGSGGLRGVGFGQGLQKLGFLKYAYADFIFSTIGEELGFVGVAAVVLLFATFIWMGFRIARTAPDRLGMLLAAGLTTMLGVTATIHMAVTLALVPTTGLTLPFVSYGRSNLLVSLFATGVIVNVGLSRGRARAR